VRRHFAFIALCVIFFLLPLQIFIIGENDGIGIQGSTYRYQITSYGTSFIPIPREIGYVLSGTYSGKTALSVFFWVAGTTVLACTLVFTNIYASNDKIEYFQQLFYGLIASCVLYLGSCIIQYGVFFRGPAGISFPVGIIAVLIWVTFFYFYGNILKIS
jgi:hypothetical protein